MLQRRGRSRLLLLLTSLVSLLFFPSPSPYFVAACTVVGVSFSCVSKTHTVVHEILGRTTRTTQDILAWKTLLHWSSSTMRIGTSSVIGTMDSPPDLGDGGGVERRTWENYRPSPLGKTAFGCRLELCIWKKQHEKHSLPLRYFVCTVVN